MFFCTKITYRIGISENFQNKICETFPLFFFTVYRYTVQSAPCGTVVGRNLPPIGEYSSAVKNLRNWSAPKG